MLGGVTRLILPLLRGVAHLHVNSPYFCVFKYARRARKTLKPRFTDFFTDFEKKTDCFAVYDPLIIAKRNKYFVILKKYTIK